MRVLFNSRDTWKKICICGGCTSQLEVTADDLTFVPDSRDGDAYTFTCPVCSHVNWINAQLVPKGAVAR